MTVKKKKNYKYKRIDELTIKTDRIEILLKDFISDLKKRDDWVAWFGILITLLSTFFFSDFKGIGSVDADSVRMIYGSITIICTVMFIKSVITRISINGKDSVEYIIDKILSESKTPYEFRLLYVIKRGSVENAKILVFYDELYKCYMLPHARTEEINASEELAKIKISEYIQIPSKAIRINHYRQNLEKISKKFSEYHGLETVYNFSFCNIVFNTTLLPAYIKDTEFVVNGRTFKWMSLAELDHDENTRKKNGDVIRFIEDNTVEFFSVNDSL